MNIIGDVAGRFDELMELLKIMPQNEKILLVGDLVDRGPKSMEVVTWAMSNPNVIALKGNHEDMMIDAYDHYSMSNWEQNGGIETLKSYGGEYADIPESHIKWMQNLPVSYREDGLFVSHAPWPYERDLDFTPYDAFSLERTIWNRFPPRMRKGVYQIHGHNTVAQDYKYAGKSFAQCIDNSGNNKLRGIHWPSKQIFEVDYK